MSASSASSSSSPSTSSSPNSDSDALTNRRRSTTDRISSKTKGREPRFNYNANPFDSTPDPDSHTYRMVTARELTKHKTPPRRVKMLARDFIDDCLYNPHYGYFSTQAVIFNPDDMTGKRATKPIATSSTNAAAQDVAASDMARAEGFNFNKMKTTTEFEFEVARRYGEFEGFDVNGKGKGPGRQVWHTPTELFKPWYGRAIARFLVSEYKLNLYPYEDLIIYEIGAGNGTLMGDILDYIAECEPEVYNRTRYRIVEISERLGDLQRGRARGGDGGAAMKGPAPSRGHADKVEVLHSSIFDFDKVVPEPCFFLALEVLDNFAHDVVRYTTLDHEPYQCVVSIDSTGDYTELYEPVSDPLIKRYLDLRSHAPTTSNRRSPAVNRLLDASPLLRKIYASIPFAPNLTTSEFIPTKQLMLLDVLRDKFPAHRILFSDFSSLPDAIPGKTAPVVQTRYEGETVACTTYLVQPGFFDIFFPTDFHLLRDLYSLVMARPLSSATETPSLAASASPRVTTDFFSPYNARNGAGRLAGSKTAGGRGAATGDDTTKTYARETITEATREAQHGVGPRNFNLLSIIGLAYATLNSPTAGSTSLSVALPSGGNSVVLWGLVVAFIGNLAMALSLAEICTVYTTNGGPYHWASILSPSKYAPFISFCAGWFASSGWWALFATAPSLAGSLITGAYAVAHPDFEPERWQIYIVYIGYTVIACLLNLYAYRVLPYLNQGAILWSLAGVVVIAITCLSVAAPNFATGRDVFGGFTNTTGWPDGFAWLLGLLQASFSLIGVDAVTHMVEEMPSPHRNAPIAMVLAVVIGAGASFVFLVCLLFSINDLTAVIESTAGALLATIFQATSSVVGTILLAVFPIGSMLFTAQGILTGSSRMTFSFARDGGLPFSRFFARLNPHNGVPERSVILVSVVGIIFGVLYIPSSSAFNAIISSSIVFLNISYTLPVVLLLVRGRHLLRPESFPEPAFTLGRAGPFINIVAVAFTSFTTVLFLFPPEYPTTASSMNYTIVVFGLVVIVAAVTWIFDGRKHFIGPRDLGGLLELARAEIDTTHMRPLHEDKEKQAAPVVSV
ncbi:hypothetical protein OIO90_003106 [Microbotryomycetes sp. JL221]|nr:hypothetical protein OIO90_003106 [Microbotryomycetes sp. JL221]